MMSRISIFKWDAQARKVTARMDAAGAALLFLYVLIMSSRREILGQWLTADTLAAASIAMAGGALLGRNIAMRKRIHGLLMQVGLVPEPAAGMLESVGRGASFDGPGIRRVLDIGRRAVSRT
jgi:hypothetical protein